jgi:hypothetical protein
MVASIIPRLSVIAFVWSCLAALGNLPISANAAIEQGGTRLYTEYVAYCSEAKAVIVNQFDIAYFKANHSVVFQISAASVEPNLNISANILAVAYGKNLLNYTINLCDYLEGVLCPLPQINFTGMSRSRSKHYSVIDTAFFAFVRIRYPTDTRGCTGRYPRTSMVCAKSRGIRSGHPA